MKKTIALAAAVLVGLTGGATRVATAYEPPATTECETTVGVIGDSLTYQYGNGKAELHNILKKRGYNLDCVRIDPVTGRGIGAAVNVVSNWREERPAFNPDVFVIALGTNHPKMDVEALTKAAKKLVKEIGPAPAIHWIGLAFVGTETPQWTGCVAAPPPDNTFSTPCRVAFLQDAVVSIRNENSEIPRVVFHDWNSVVHRLPQHNLWFGADHSGHMTTEPGYRNRNDYVADILIGIGKEG